MINCLTPRRRSFLRRNIFPILLPALALLQACGGETKTDAGKAPPEFELAPGFELQLVASEPLVFDPVDMTFDEFGRMFVVEMGGMPLDKSGKGRVVYLSDTDGDGVMDKRTVFADSLVMPAGVMRWKNGFLVTDPPRIYYMEDQDGDGRADLKQIMMDGFDTSNLEANVNNPLYGLDNWIYLANSPAIRHGNIHFTANPAKKLKEGTLRIRPETLELELTAGNTQFGHAFDTWGRHFMLNNHLHIMHEVIQARYLQRNPDLLAGRATQVLPDHYRVYSIAENPEYQMLTDIGSFTSACGLTIYQGDAFPAEYTGAVFVAEPASNIVHVDRLVDSGVSFHAESLFTQKEFLACRDPYSRIVNIVNGPDGALYLVDFYRQVIEGPEFMSDEVKARINLYNGNEKGRIYRLTAKGAAPADWFDRLSLAEASAEALAGYLSHPNGWWRIEAQRLLMDRKPAEVLPLIHQLAADSSRPLGRLHALWTLDGWDELTTDEIRSALRDPAPGLRANAIRLAESRLGKEPALAQDLLSMKDDPDIKVRFQLVCTLGDLKSPEADQARLDLLFRDLRDRWIQVAALSAGATQAVPLLEGVLDRFEAGNESYASLVRLLGGIIGKSTDRALLQRWIGRAAGSTDSAAGAWQSPLLEGLSDGLANRKPASAGLDEQRISLLRVCTEHPATSARSSARRMLGILGLPAGARTEQAMQLALATIRDSAGSQAQRAEAIALLALHNAPAYESLFRNLVHPGSPAVVQTAAIRALGLIPGTANAVFLMDRWNTLTADLRVEAINGFLMDDARTGLFLDRIQAGQINKGAMSWDQSVRIRSGGANMQRAREMLTETDSSRREVIGRYNAVLTMRGDPKKGERVYQAQCAVCHQVGGKGGRFFGPDLGTIHAWPPADILTAILDPNKSIALGFDLWSVQLHNGESRYGIITGETPTAVTLTTAEGQVYQIARTDIASIAAQNTSAMPADLEQKIDQQQMADLLAYIRGIRP